MVVFIDLKKAFDSARHAESLTCTWRKEYKEYDRGTNENIQ